MLSQFCPNCGFHSALEKELCRQCGYEVEKAPEYEREVIL
jgi:uncharacterized membrane protein YvbJ